MIPRTYRRILAIPAVRMPLTGATIGRLPFAAGALAVVLLVQGATGSFAQAGLVNGAYSIAVAATMPLWGRLIDRVGQTGVFVVTTAVSSAAQIALVILAEEGAALAPMVAAAAVAGANVPPIGTSIRTLWAGLIPDPVLRQSAFALDAVMLEVAFVTGPLLIGLVIAVASPAAAVLVNVALAVLGSAVFAASRASREWRGETHEVGRVGPLRAPGVAVLMGAAYGLGLTVGAIELGITAFAAHEGARAAAGGLIAAQAAGSFAGGLAYGARTWRGPAGPRLTVLSVILTLTVVPLVAVPTLAAAFPLMLVSGVALAPTTSVIYLMLDFLAPRGTAAEATGWVLMAVITGAASGTALAGAAVGASGAHAGIAVGLAGAALAALVSGLGRDRLHVPATPVAERVAAG
jgi:MFS family permease